MKGAASENSKFSSLVVKAILIISVVLLFLFSIDLVITALSDAVGYINHNLLSSDLDPFVGLFLGLLITAIIQSSSTITTMVVALVATGTLSLQEAVPIIMGANVGTTLTSNIVALGFISNKRRFRRAVAVGSMHDFYNIILVMVWFPLEYRYGALSRMSIFFTDLIFGEELGHHVGMVDQSTGKGWTAGVVNWFDNSLLVLGLSLVLLFVSIKLLALIIKKTIIGESKNKLGTFVFDRPLKSFSWGVLLTAAIQSSSVTTSILVPLAATDKVKVKSAFPFIIGANLGTTLTALIAAGFRSEVAATIAIAHLVFNLSGAIIFMAIPVFRNFMIDFSKQFSIWVSKYRVIGLAYILIMFFLLPFLLISFGRSERVAKLKAHNYAIERRVGK